MPHRKNAVFAVGYVRTSSFYPDSAVEKATENGIESLARSVSVRIKGERGFIDESFGSEFVGEDFQEKLPKSVLDFVKKNYKIVATETAEEITLVLLCTGDAPSISSAKGFNPRRPDWVFNPPRRSGFLYAVGQYQRQYHEEDAWRLAEYDARISLALSLFSQLQSLIKKLDRSLIIVTTNQTDVVLNGMQVDKRWVDQENEILYVLVRMRLRDNAQSFINQLQKIIPPQPHRQGRPSQEEIIRKAFEELDEIN